MRQICYQVAMSLDGYIAGPQGDYDWIPDDPEIDFTGIFDRFDTLLMGRKTYEVARAQGDQGPLSGIKSVVVSRTLRPDDHPGITIISGDLAGAVAKLRDQPGKDIWLFGGGELFRSLLQIKMVDSVELAVIPVLLGGGIPMLPAPSEQAKLRLVNTRVYKASGIVMLEYARA